MIDDKFKALPVSVHECKSYDTVAITELFRNMLSELSLDSEVFRGKRVMIKPNLVMPTAPENAATTHPAVMEAICLLMKEFGADAVIAESSGGPYTKGTLRIVYNACGITEVSERTGVPLNFDTASSVISAPNGLVSKNFELIKPVSDADIILNMSKLKTHSLTQLSGSVKNFFGTIPGVQKVGMHARFKDYKDFSGMLVDLCSLIHETKRVVNFMDAVMCMEGNGPTGGTKKFEGLLLASENPFNLDIAASYLVGNEGEVQMLELAKERGLCVNSSSELVFSGTPLPEIKHTPFVHPDTKVTSKMSLIPSFLSPRPAVVKKSCVGCGKCAASCPAKTIKIINKKAHINRSECIKCYCCQELCPIHAIKIKKSLILKLIK